MDPRARARSVSSAIARMEKLAPARYQFCLVHPCRAAVRDIPLMVVGRRSQFASTPSDRFFRWCFFRILPRGRRLPNCFSGFCANIVKHKQHTTPGRVEAGRHRTGTTRVGSIMITNHRRVSGPALYRGGHYGKCDNWNVNHRKSGNEYNNKDGR